MNENNKTRTIEHQKKEEQRRGEERGGGGGRSKCKLGRDDTKAGVLKACSGSLDGVLGWDGMRFDVILMLTS